jgi:ubiquinone/menaquinone biosynthesis C-methylase UbiE
MKRLEPQTAHPLLALGDHDDRARQDYAFTLRNFMTGELMPANRSVFERRAAPGFERAKGRAPETSKDVRDAMWADDWFRFYASARRTSQEMIWGAVAPAVDKLNPPARSSSAGGTLTLNAELKPPTYATAIDIHCMPGGYGLDRGPDDLAAGALYDRGVYLYLSGLAGGLNDGVGRLAGHWLKSRFPELAPKRILDLGCGVGHATLPYCDIYPDAEIYGVDVGAGLLRYAHARAEALGKKAHFLQADAAATPFKDASFDLVLSHIFLHETSGKALPAILKESRRLLAPGGVMAHVDQPRFSGLDPYQTFMQENETHFNNEPFWIRFRTLDLVGAAQDAGFSAQSVEEAVLSTAIIEQNQKNDRGEPPSGAPKRGFYMIVARG